MASEGNNNDDTVSLEALVSDSKQAAPANAVSETLNAAAAADSAPSVAVNDGEAATPLLANIDGVLAQEDPKFAESMRELSQQADHSAEAGEVEIKPMELSSLPIEKRQGKWLHYREALRIILFYILWPFRMALEVRHHAHHILPFIKRTAKATLGLVKHGFRAAIGGLKSVIGAFFHLPRLSKVSLFAALILGIAAVLSLKVLVFGHMRLASGPEILHSFADLADEKFTYAEDEEREDFNDPFHHPEHVVEIEHIVVNLRRQGRADSENPMGLFAFYIETSNQEAAVELRDRDGEVRDVLSRALEQMRSDDLATIVGKEKLKVMLRQALNGLLTRGQVRRVYLKNIVLKP